MGVTPGGSGRTGESPVGQELHVKKEMIDDVTCTTTTINARGDADEHRGIAISVLKGTLNLRNRYGLPFPMTMLCAFQAMRHWPARPVIRPRRTTGAMLTWAERLLLVRIRAVLQQPRAWLKPRLPRNSPMNPWLNPAVDSSGRPVAGSQGSADQYSTPSVSGRYLGKHPRSRPTAAFWAPHRFRGTPAGA